MAKSKGKIYFSPGLNYSGIEQCMCCAVNEKERKAKKTAKKAQLNYACDKIHTTLHTHTHRCSIR